MVARKAEPRSLHAILGGSERLLCCSYDSRGAARELEMFFSQQQPQSPAPSAVPALPPALMPLTPQHMWLALPASTGTEVLDAFWALHHLLWCGFTLSNLQRARLTADGVRAASVKARGPVEPAPAGLLGAAGSGEPLLLLQLSKEEGMAQVVAALENLQPLRGAAYGGRLSLDGGQGRRSWSGTGAASEPFIVPVAGVSFGDAEVIQALCQPLSTALPQQQAAQQLLEAAAHTVSADNSATPSSRSTDQVLVIALQSKSMHDSFLLALELLRSQSGQDGTPAVELVGCRLLKQVPADISRYLTDVVDASRVPNANRPSSAKASPVRLMPGHPVLLLALHGPDPQAHLASALANLQHVFSTQSGTTAAKTSATSGSAEDGADSNTDTSAKHAGLLQAMGPHAVQQYAPSSYRPALVVATSSKAHDSHHLLTHCFHPSQVRDAYHCAGRWTVHLQESIVPGF